MLLTTFVVPPLGGIEAATKPQVPVKTGTTNGGRLLRSFSLHSCFLFQHRDSTTFDLHLIVCELVYNLRIQNALLLKNPSG